MFKKKSLYLLVVLSLILLVVGCSSSSPNDYTEDSAYGLKVTLDIPSKLLSEIRALTIEEHTTINEAKVSLYQGEEFIESKSIKDFSIDNQDNEVVFGDIEIGEEYKVKAELIGNIREEEESKTLYKGEVSSLEVKANSITEVNVKVKPLPATSLEIEKINVTGSDIEVEQITLKHSFENKLTKPYEEGVNFTNDELDLIPARWSLIVELEGGIEGGREILLLPTEEKQITLDIEVDEETGGINIGIITHASPEAPTNLELDNDNNLIWDGSADFYKVYQSQTDNTADIGVAVAEVEDNIYKYIEGGYYYWVRAYIDGYSSGLSEPLFVEEESDSTALTKYQFDSNEEKEINLGKLAENESAVIAISPLNLDPDSTDIYEAQFNVNFSDGSTSSQLSLNSFVGAKNNEISPQAEVDAEMRRLEDEFLAMDLESIESPSYQASAELSYELGDSRVFYNRTDNEVSSTLKAIGDKVLIYVEEGHSLEKATLDEIVIEYDTNIYPTIMNYFAFHDDSEYDWDGNGKTIILIEDMGGSSTEGMMMGYFHSKDFYSNEKYDNLDTSNEADMFYINYQAVKEAEDGHHYFNMNRLLQTIAHEFQHLIFFVNKHNSGRDITDTWINEGFSILAEHLTGYRYYNDDNRISDHYFTDTSSTSLMGWEQELSDYGVNALFALYLYERLGEGIIEDIQTANSCASEVISNNYYDFSDLLLGGMISNYIDDQGLERYSYSAVNLEHKPEIELIDGSISENISIKSTAVKYFKIKGNGSNVDLVIEGLNEDTGVVIYRD